MPDVPNLPGVPVLSSYATDALKVELLVTDLLILFPGALTPQWGIFLDGEPIIVPDTIVNFEYKQDWSIMEYPIEQGSFETYNKVQHPFETRLRMSTGGTKAARQAFLAQLQAIAGDLNLYDVVTPEIVYPSCNIMHVDYRRAAQQGANMITVDVWLKQINDNVETTFSNTQQPDGASPVSGGNVQPVTPTTSQLSTMQNYNIGAFGGT